MLCLELLTVIHTWLAAKLYSEHFPHWQHPGKYKVIKETKAKSID